MPRRRLLGETRLLSVELRVGSACSANRKTEGATNVKECAYVHARRILPEPYLGTRAALELPAGRPSFPPPGRALPLRCAPPPGRTA